METKEAAVRSGVLAWALGAVVAAGCMEPGELAAPEEAPLEKPGQAPPAEPPLTTSAPGFELVWPDDVALAQGATLAHEVGITSLGGFTGQVVMSATTSYPLALAFSPSTVTAPGRTALSITAPCDFPAVPRQVQVTGTSGTYVKTRSLSVRVFPFGSFFASRASVHVPRAVPDNHLNGATSTLFFTEPQAIQHLIVEPRLTHPRPADLVVSLIPPSGSITTLHNHGAALAASYSVFTYNASGMPLAGDWKLRVVDSVTGEAGTIDGWSMRAMVRGLPPPPVASFAVDVSGLAATFRDSSTDPQACGGNGELVSWSWSFGDGATSTDRHPVHTYAAAGLYDVTLTVTNGSDVPAQSTQRVVVP